MPTPKVCSIIVTYNGIQWIEKCLSSINGSSIKCDIFVVDNCSTDGTLQYLQKSDKCHYLHSSTQNLGFGKANNIALKDAYSQDYDYFLLLNQDAWVDKNVIEYLMAQMTSQAGFGILSPLHFNGEGSKLDPLFENYLTRIPAYQEDLKNNTLNDQLYESPFINAACWLISRNTLETVGLFHPLFDHYGEDDNYIDRLHHHNLKLGLAPQVKMYHAREGVETNPIKNDPRRVFRRSSLRILLDPRETDAKNIFKKIRKSSKRLSREIPWIERLTFRIRCLINFRSIKREVKRFKESRQSELRIR